MNALITHTPRQIALIKDTVAKDCNHDEFDLFVEVARAKGLDPFIGQIIPMIFSKNDAKKRKMTIIITRDGQRVIAQRCGDYRPADQKADFEYDTALKGPTNPKGIVTATVYLWKQDQKTGQWHRVVGEADWDEFAPLTYAYDQYDYTESGEHWPNGDPKKNKKLKPNAVQVLDDSGNWLKQPKLMIAKCAEMQALRAGWPEQFSGLYDDAEMDKARVIDRDASEIAATEHEDRRMKAIGASNAIAITWGDGWALEHVPLGDFADRVAAYIKDTDPATLAKWRDANRVAFNEFWAKQPGDALAVKKLLEAKIDAKVAA